MDLHVLTLKVGVKRIKNATIQVNGKRVNLTKVVKHGLSMVRQMK
jgi:hypothetical protein